MDGWTAAAAAAAAPRARNVGHLGRPLFGRRNENDRNRQGSGDMKFVRVFGARQLDCRFSIVFTGWPKATGIMKFVRHFGIRLL